jgi:hypothetical protein
MLITWTLFAKLLPAFFLEQSPPLSRSLLLRCTFSSLSLIRDIRRHRRAYDEPERSETRVAEGHPLSCQSPGAHFARTFLPLSIFFSKAYEGLTEGPVSKSSCFLGDPPPDPRFLASLDTLWSVELHHFFVAGFLFLFGQRGPTKAYEGVTEERSRTFREYVSKFTYDIMQSIFNS